MDTMNHSRRDISVPQSLSRNALLICRGRDVLAMLILATTLALAGCSQDRQQEATLDVSAWPANLTSPIPGATFSMAESQLPGASRHYRSGIHEGFDFFGGMSGRPLAEDEPIVAIADGTVIRIDHEYEDESPEALQFWATQSPEPGFVGEYALDRLRGRQVWIRHAEGHVSRYAHLSMVNPELQLGDEVAQGQVIGLMGNSGVPPTENQPEPPPHLHFELWSADGASHLGEGLSPLDSHRLVAELFGLEALPRYAQRTVRRINAGQNPPEQYPPTELPEIGFRVEPPRRVIEGAVFAVPVTWEGDDFTAGDFFAYLADQPLGVIDSGDGAWILGAMPADFDAQALSLTIGATDPFGQTLLGSQRIEKAAPSQRAVPLEVDPTLFALYEPGNFQIESEQLIPVVLESLSQFEALWQQPFDAPIEGDIGRPFGQRIFHGILRPDHPLPGIGVPAAEGTPVLATNSGIVGLVADLPIRGRTVALIHGGGLVSIYGHLSEVSVSVGEEVSINQPIGAVGATGAVTEPELRWEMVLAGIPTDPLQWINQLLPGRPGS